MQWFQTVFEILDYPVSLIECISVMSGIIAVYLAAKEKILTWPIGILNITTAFFIYYHVQLYSDMFLQIYFFGIGLYGWYNWKKEKRAHIPLKWLHNRVRIYTAAGIVVSTLILGWIVSRLHVFGPALFPLPASYPYADTLVAVMSIVANVLMAKRFIENWILWIAVDVLCVYLYYQKDIIFIALEFFFFLCIAVYGLVQWMKLKQSRT